jgi:hypothetical protein
MPQIGGDKVFQVQYRNPGGDWQKWMTVNYRQMAESIAASKDGTFPAGIETRVVEMAEIEA